MQNVRCLRRRAHGVVVAIDRRDVQSPRTRDRLAPRVHPPTSQASTSMAPLSSNVQKCALWSGEITTSRLNGRRAVCVAAHACQISSTTCRLIFRLWRHRILRKQLRAVLVVPWRPPKHSPTNTVIMSSIWLAFKIARRASADRRDPGTHRSPGVVAAGAAVNRGTGGVTATATRIQLITAWLAPLFFFGGQCQAGDQQGRNQSPADFPSSMPTTRFDSTRA